ncbi:hypothetical protein Trydic_g5514 [Trypoxylus dichotomus]
MYRQVEVAPQQRNLQRILWRANPRQPLEHYTLNTITYETSAASFLATRCLKQLAVENATKYPIASQVILQDFYVDNLITGCPGVQSARRLIQELEHIMKGACFLRVQVDNVTYYTDSMILIVLSWLKLKPGKLKQFVSHRIAEMQEKTLPTQWNHLLSSENPADILSSGADPAQLLNLALWWSGPSWLQSNAEEFSQELHSIPRSKTLPRNSKLVSLDPFIDNKGILRGGGRLQNARIPYGTKFPIILPGKHNFTRLLIDYEHKTNLHSGTQTTLAAIRANYCPINECNALKAALDLLAKEFSEDSSVVVQPQLADESSRKSLTKETFVVRTTINFLPTKEENVFRKQSLLKHFYFSYPIESNAVVYINNWI